MRSLPGRSVVVPRLLLSLLLLSGAISCAKSDPEDAVGRSVYDFTLTTNDGREIPLSDFRGKVLLIVNTASRCGFTPQYDGLQQLHEEYGEEGLVVLGFPCNQFLGQEPGSDEEIAEFCRVNHGVTFPLSTKIEVNGENADPLYRYLKAAAPFQGFGSSEREKAIAGILAERAQQFLLGDEIKWNFTKFLVSRDGKTVRRFEPFTEPGEMKGAVEALL